METSGPGAHSPDKADEITKVKTTNITMGTSPSRAEIYEKEKRPEVNVAPGQYDDHSNQIGFDSKGFTISDTHDERREKSVE